MLNNSPWQIGRGKLAKLTLTTPAGASAEIYRYGAHLTSWKTSGGKEWMFTSRQAQFEQGKAIRGGVPVIFPQFSGFGQGQRHGFARNVEWRLEGEHNASAQDVSCRFVLQADDKSLASWPHRFRAEFVPELSDTQLKMTLTIHNTDNRPFRFTAALHTYFAVSNVHQVQLRGLKGLSYWDNNGSDFQRDRFIYGQDALEFPDAIDRVFFDNSNPLQLIDGEHQLTIENPGFHEVVVWNPGAEATKKLNDMADDEYLQMLCVEAAIIDQPITLMPGESWSGAQVLRA
jgi:glucose-6-phosphate 1-epimerase